MIDPNHNVTVNDFDNFELIVQKGKKAFKKVKCN